ncbi:hypothetical protein [Vibrio mangrovi]|uniref:Uncharacterized protein n=1 Tax=Vibrio mangrovi TaxID=474394 RepID=A0ABU4I9J7_9VIBR|nr:hypothetical protein [Vibrio mangrovi]MDW6004641.1 hypothetical protein [Vibrio mangrovi]
MNCNMAASGIEVAMHYTDDTVLSNRVFHIREVPATMVFRKFMPRLHHPDNREQNYAVIKK